MTFKVPPDSCQIIRFNTLIVLAILLALKPFPIWDYQHIHTVALNAAFHRAELGIYFLGFCPHLALHPSWQPHRKLLYMESNHSMSDPILTLTRSSSSGYWRDFQCLAWDFNWIFFFFLPQTVLSVQSNGLSLLSCYDLFSTLPFFPVFKKSYLPRVGYAIHFPIPFLRAQLNDI